MVFVLEYQLYYHLYHTLNRDKDIHKFDQYDYNKDTGRGSGRYYCLDCDESIDVDFTYEYSNEDYHYYHIYAGSISSSEGETSTGFSEMIEVPHDYDEYTCVLCGYESLNYHCHYNECEHCSVTLLYNEYGNYQDISFTGFEYVDLPEDYQLDYYVCDDCGVAVFMSLQEKDVDNMHYVVLTIEIKSAVEGGVTLKKFNIVVDSFEI